MKRSTHGVRVRVDGYTKLCLTAITALLTILIVGLWAERVPGTPAAQGKGKDLMGDAGGQRAAMIKELQNISQGLQKSNGTLEEMLAVLKSGRLKVQAISAEGKVPGGGHAETPKPTLKR